MLSGSKLQRHVRHRRLFPCVDEKDLSCCWVIVIVVL